MEKKEVLIVVDMQNDFIDGVLGTAEAQAIIKPMENYIRNFCGDIIFTLDTHGDDYLNTSEGKKLPIPHCIYGTEGHSLKDELFLASVHDGKKIQIYNKDRFADISILLDSIIKNADEIYLCGVCTDICVVSNALCLKALYPDKKICVIESLCAGTTKENHDATIKTMRSCQIDISDVDMMEK